MGKEVKLEVTKIESPADLTVGQYIDYTDKLKVKNGVPTVDVETQNSHALKIFCNVPYDVQSKMKQSDKQALMSSLSDAFSEVPIFVQNFELEGVEYGFIPKLSEITAGEYIDLDTYLNDTLNAHKAMAVMYRPVTKDYKGLYMIESYKGSAEYSDIMLKAPLSVYLGAQVFFWNLEKDLSALTLQSSLSQMMTNQKDGVTGQSGSIKNGVGMPRLTRLLITKLNAMKLLPNNQ